MKFTAATVSAAILIAASSSIDSSLYASAFAFAPSPVASQRRSNTAFLSSPKSLNKSIFAASSSSSSRVPHFSSALSMSSEPLSIGIVGATGAVGKEIRSCLAQRQADGKISMSKLRIFGSERSAGKVLDGVTVELFDVDKARECDVVFLAVSGDFSKAHAKAITKGDDGAVCIDNSVRRTIIWTNALFSCLNIF
jgi:Semialdehyde dehydrogenase, NAD binding domain